MSNAGPPTPPSSELPAILVHYASGPPFVSMMDLDAEEREAVLGDGRISGPARYRDPAYVDTRMRVEAEMYAQFVAAGGEPLRRHPHYALLGRSARSEAAPGRKLAYVLQREQLPAAQVTFTWGDSFTFDPEYRRLTGKGHPASGRAWRLHELHGVLARWAGSTARPAWQEVELQLWFDPRPEAYVVLPLAGTP